MLIAVSYMQCGANLRAKLYTAINSFSANHAYLKTLYKLIDRGEKLHVFHTLNGDHHAGFFSALTVL